MAQHDSWRRPRRPSETGRQLPVLKHDLAGDIHRHRASRIRRTSRETAEEQTAQKSQQPTARRPRRLSRHTYGVVHLYLSKPSRATRVATALGSERPGSAAPRFPCVSDLIRVRTARIFAEAVGVDHRIVGSGTDAEIVPRGGVQLTKYVPSSRSSACGSNIEVWDTHASRS